MRLQPEFEPLAVDVAMAARLLGVSRSTVYRLVEAGELPTVQLRRRRLIEVEELRRIVAANRVGCERTEAREALRALK